MTFNDAQRIIENMMYTGTKYKSGYNCYLDDNLSQYDLVNLGSNAGKFGYNFTLYYHKKSDTLYCSNYRKAPKIDL